MKNGDDKPPQVTQTVDILSLASLPMFHLAVHDHKHEGALSWKWWRGRKEGKLVNESTEAVEVKQNVLIKNHSPAHG